MVDQQVKKEYESYEHRRLLKLMVMFKMEGHLNYPKGIVATFKIKLSMNIFHSIKQIMKLKRS